MQKVSAITLIFLLAWLLAIPQLGAGQTIPTNLYLPITLHQPPPTPTGTTIPTNTPVATSTPTATNQPANTATPTATATQALLFICDHDAYNCSSFTTQAAAQAVYDYCVAEGFGDVHRLDGNNNNGLACESLPLAKFP